MAIFLLLPNMCFRRLHLVLDFHFGTLRLLAAHFFDRGRFGGPGLVVLRRRRVAVVSAVILHVVVALLEVLHKLSIHDGVFGLLVLFFELDLFLAFIFAFGFVNVFAFRFDLFGIERLIECTLPRSRATR
jgi:hypothetical protein